MAKKVKQGRIMPGFPKLAFYVGPTPFTVSFPGSPRTYWNHKRRILNPEELVVVVAEHHITGYHDRVANQYELSKRWTGPPFPVNYIIPVEAIGKGEIPITCIYNWTQGYKQLPTILPKYLRFIERDIGKEPFETATAI